MLNLIRSSASARSWSEGSLSRVTLRAVAVAAVLSTGAAVLAQVPMQQLKEPATSVGQTNFPITLSSSVAGDSLFSSSETEQVDSPALVASLTPTVPNFEKMMGVGSGGAQTPAYQRPRYRSGFMHDDGSLRWTTYLGGGATVPVANASKYLTPNFDIQAGAGYRFSKHFSLPVEFDWDQFGFTKSALDNQIGIYDSILGTNSGVFRLDGNSHIWSFSLQPTYTIRQGDRWGSYAKVGVGFYHKVANFTLPAGGYACGFYYYGSCNFNLDHYTSNAPGYDAGFGVTYRVSPDSHARFYAEARYVFIDNQQRYGITNNAASLATISDSTTDFYPANSNRTQYIPVEVGIRF
jgi:hypothetical protein